MVIEQASWFTVEAIDAQTFAISEYGHWERVHSYLFLGHTHAALIDTGTGIGDIATVVRTLTALPVQVITTHCHWDHIGGHHAFREIAIHEADRAWLEQGIPVPLQQIRQMVMKEPFTIPSPGTFDITQYYPYTGRPTRVLVDGDSIDLGGRLLEVLHTPGHAPGHICLYEQRTGYLVTGDLIYAGTLYANYPSTDPVLFAQSVARLVDLAPITRLLPGHNQLDLPVSLLAAIHTAFQTLASRRQLRHGTGLHQFDAFAILL